MESKTNNTKQQQQQQQVIDKQYIPFFLEYTLMGEYQMLRSQNLNGIYVIPSARTPLVWFGIVFVRHGLYQGGIFRFCIIIPPNYPNGPSPPQVIFNEAPFHPLVDAKTGELEVSRAFPRWKRDVHRIYNVLAFTRRIFFKIDTEGARNAEAAALYKSKLLAFKERAVASIERSRARLNDAPKTNDPNELVFNLLDGAHLHEARKQQMVTVAAAAAAASDDEGAADRFMTGLSWVENGRFSPFSKR